MAPVLLTPTLHDDYFTHQAGEYIKNPLDLDGSMPIPFTNTFHVLGEIDGLADSVLTLHWLDRFFYYDLKQIDKCAWVGKLDRYESRMAPYWSESHCPRSIKINLESLGEKSEGSIPKSIYDGIKPSFKLMTVAVEWNYIPLLYYWEFRTRTKGE